MGVLVIATIPNKDVVPNGLTDDLDLVVDARLTVDGDVAVRQKKSEAGSMVTVSMETVDAPRDSAEHVKKSLEGRFAKSSLATPCPAGPC